MYFNEVLLFGSELWDLTFDLTQVPLRPPAVTERAKHHGHRDREGEHQQHFQQLLFRKSN